MNSADERGANGRRIGCRPCDLPARIGCWAVNHNATVNIQAVLFDNTHNANDGDLSLGIRPDLFADGIAIRPETLRELLVDDADLAGVCRHVHIVEDSALY